MSSNYTRRRNCVWSHVTVWVFMTLAMGALAALIACGVIIVRPYNGALGYTNTTCTVIPSNFNATWTASYPRGCGCGRTCSSEYPCMKINVHFVVPGQGEFETKFYQSESEMNGQECSYEVGCNSDRDTNTATARQYLEDLYANTAPFPCFYDPSKGQQSDVFKAKRYGFDAALHSMLWPAIGLLIGLIGFTVSLVHCVMTYKSSQSNNFTTGVVYNSGGAQVQTQPGSQPGSYPPQTYSSPGQPPPYPGQDSMPGSSTNYGYTK